MGCSAGDLVAGFFRCLHRCHRSPKSHQTTRVFSEAAAGNPILYTRL
jgi:hypothetical protein